jgi:hypothetical protein
MPSISHSPSQLYTKKTIKAGSKTKVLHICDKKRHFTPKFQFAEYLGWPVYPWSPLWKTKISWLIQNTFQIKGNLLKTFLKIWSLSTEGGGGGWVKLLWKVPPAILIFFFKPWNPPLKHFKQYVLSVESDYSRHKIS